MSAALEARCMSLGDDELLAHMESMGMPKSMLVQLTEEQKQQMKQMIMQDPKQQADCVARKKAATTLASSQPAAVYFELVAAAHIDRAFEIESEGYPADEAATHEGLVTRQRDAGQFFLGMYTSEQHNAADLVGFVCGTCCQGAELLDETMSTHDISAKATTVCIHSVVVEEHYRRKGLATAMLKEYVRRLKTYRDVQLALMIAKAHLLSFYINCGFSVVRLSPVVHGQDPWFELKLDLDEARVLRFAVADAFTDKAFGGNPAGVVVLEEWSGKEINSQKDEKWFQQVAMEMALSETAFLQRAKPTAADDGSSETFHLRWFTPTAEVDLCGHATLASSHVLWESGHADPNKPLRFLTKSGTLGATNIGTNTSTTTTTSTTTSSSDSSGAKWIELSFPAEVAKPRELAKVPHLLGDGSAGSGAFVGLTPKDILWVGANRLDLLVELTPEAFESLQPNMQVLSLIENRGVLVTASGKGLFDLRASSAADTSIFTSATSARTVLPLDCESRCFFPRVGVPEDPVTGSAHCGIAPVGAIAYCASSIFTTSPYSPLLHYHHFCHKYSDTITTTAAIVSLFCVLFLVLHHFIASFLQYWAEKLGRTDLLAYQNSARGGVLKLRVDAAEGSGRVYLAGQSVTTSRGSLAPAAHAHQ
jgi:predicted PhzF superfamily epimerase YddE/YHI9/GNAT superfamily N-acetyltransferase